MACNENCTCLEKFKDADEVYAQRIKDVKECYKYDYERIDCEASAIVLELIKELGYAKTAREFSDLYIRY